MRVLVLMVSPRSKEGKFSSVYMWRAERSNDIERNSSCWMVHGQGLKACNFLLRLYSSMADGTLVSVPTAPPPSPSNPRRKLHSFQRQVEADLQPWGAKAKLEGGCCSQLRVGGKLIPCQLRRD